MAIDIAEIKRLRELTGVGMTDAKRALDDANGDFDKALSEMRKKGLTKAEKRALGFADQACEFLDGLDWGAGDRSRPLRIA